MRLNPKINMFSSGFCLGGLLLAFRHALPTTNPNDVAILIIGITGFLINLWIGIRDDLGAVRYKANVRCWLKAAKEAKKEKHSDI